MKYNFCPKCGFKLTGECNFCPKCGANLNEIAGGAASAAPAQENKTEQKAGTKSEKFVFEFSEDTAGLNESFDKQLKEQAKPKVPAGIIDKDKALDMYWSGFENDIKNSIKSIIYYAKQGDAECQHAYGTYCCDGYRLGTVKIDYKEAYQWFLKSAEQGYGPAATCIGDMYKDGQYVSKSKEKAIQWYKKGLELGDVGAKYDLKDMGIEV